MTDYTRRSYDAHYDEILAELRTNVALLTALTKQHDIDIGTIQINLYGRDGRNGINGRINTLERTEERRTWHIRALWTACVGAAAAWWTSKG